MDELRNFPGRDREKKELEEIAHLYFSRMPSRPEKGADGPGAEGGPGPSGPSVPGGEPKVGSGIAPAARRFLGAPEPLYVCCATDASDRSLATWFFFNLAVVLRVLNGPVLLVASERACESRFSFGFRPDRERVHSRVGMALTSRSLGPMGICLVEGSGLAGELSGRPPARDADLVRCCPVPFRYVLSDEPRLRPLFGFLPGLVLLLVTPSTPEGLAGKAILPAEEGGQGFVGRRDRPVHVGVVVAGTSSREEADRLFGRWREMLEGEFTGGDVVVEDFGALEGWSATPGGGADVPGWGIQVLEHPTSLESRWCMTAASRLRAKRRQLLRLPS